MILIYADDGAGNTPIEGKFLQLRLAARDYLVFASATEYRYHNQILARFLSEQSIPHRWEDAENLVVEARVVLRAADLEGLLSQEAALEKRQVDMETYECYSKECTEPKMGILRQLLKRLGRE